ncbi:Uncharacterized protein APZ42_005978 [Daphnia magna]|uniref:Uncharacterized protein n=1 Tax=Daphnia magna TaxID=35525 RepID=A0A164G592_9CRUS|nr:Uncharacterized protein APZ42_005978 [Daphnia magna]
MRLADITSTTQRTHTHTHTHMQAVLHSSHTMVCCGDWCVSLLMSLYVQSL